MANTTKVNNVRMQKSKTPEQIRKRYDNVAAAAKRLEALQSKQRLIKELRQKGEKGPDEKVYLREMLRLAILNDERRARIELEQAKQWVQDVLSTPIVGGTITRWLKDRINLPPIEVRRIVEQFLSWSHNVKIHQDVIEHRLNCIEEREAREAIAKALGKETVSLNVGS